MACLASVLPTDPWDPTIDANSITGWPFNRLGYKRQGVKNTKWTFKKTLPALCGYCDHLFYVLILCSKYILGTPLRKDHRDNSYGGAINNWRNYLPWQRKKVRIVEKMSTMFTCLHTSDHDREVVQLIWKMTMTAFGIFWNIHTLQSWLVWPRCQRWPWPPFETVRNRGLRSSRQMNRQRGFSRCIIFKIFGVPSPSSSWSSSPSSWSSISIIFMNRQQQVPVLHNIQHIWPPFQTLGED